MAHSVQVKFELSRSDGFLIVYAKFRTGKVHTTYEVGTGIAADVDREGRVLGVEVVKTFSTKPKKKIHGAFSIHLDQVQKAIEKRFETKFDREFGEIREAGKAIFSGG